MHSLPIVLISAPLILLGCAHDRRMGKTEVAGPAVACYRSDDSPSESGPHFARAGELYALGPTRAAEVLEELDLELSEHPENLDALVLKATTQMGVDQLDAALATLARHDEIASKTHTISPSAILLRARCLYYKGDYEAAKKNLEPFWAFFQGDPKSKSRYDSLMAAIMAKLPKPGDT